MLGDQPVWALGAMSGTSLDGVDAALVFTDGVDILKFGETGFRPYTIPEQSVLSSALGMWDAPDGVNALIMQAHAELLSGFAGVRLVGFHGQTLAHEPRGRGTYQAGDGTELANELGVPVVWDFRSSDIELGGQGAPLAPFFHFACAKWIKAIHPIAILNLGGVGNVTWIDPSRSDPTDEGALLAFDTGPANAPINDLMNQRRGLAMDRNGVVAAAGKVKRGALETFLSDAYFHRIPPKSLDRDAFRGLLSSVAALSDEDACATLTAAVAASVVKAGEFFPRPPMKILVTGGGRHNPVLMKMLQAGYDCPVEPIETAGLNGDMLEAQAFAYLAVRVMRGFATSCPSTTGVAAAVGGGQISTPDRPI